MSLAQMRLAALCIACSLCRVTSRTVMLDLPPRFMWGWSPPAWAVGYCGSASVQTVGLYYGNWITQDAARGTNGGTAAENSLLLGGHHEKDTYPSSESNALKLLNFEYSSWDDRNAKRPQHEAFIEWARSALDRGAPVIFGVYMPGDNDVDYDHIVPMVGHDAAALYFNDLHSNSTMRYKISDFVQSREHCNKESSESRTENKPNKSAADQEVFRYCLPPVVNYGISVYGNADPLKELLPARLRVNSWSEPDYSKEDAHHEVPVEMHGTLTVEKLQAGKRYALLQYNEPASVPDRHFLRRGGFASRTDFVGPAAGKAEFSTKFMSNSTRFFRCVRAREEQSSEQLMV